MATAPSSARAPEPARYPDEQSGLLGVPAATATSQPAGPSGERVASYSIPAWAVARYTLVILLVLLGLLLLWKIQEVLFLLLLAILFATAIEPLVNFLRRGPFSRGQGILIVYSVIFVVIAAIAFLFIPGLIEETGRFVETLPGRIASLRPLIDQIGIRPLRLVLQQAVGEAQPAVERTLQQPDVMAEPAKLAEAGGAFLHTLLSVVTVFLLTYYWLTERAIIKRAVLRLVPRSQARRVNSTWLEVEAKLGGWVRGQLLVMLLLGLMAFVAFVLLGLPNPLFLAVLAGLFEIIPLIGPFLAFLPALLVALTVDPSRALILLPIIVVVQQIEGNVLIPRIMSHSVGISPLTVILGILIGSLLYGPAGAFLAVPVAAAIQVILNEVLTPTLEEDDGRVPVSDAELAGDQPAPNRSEAEPVAG